MSHTATALTMIVYPNLLEWTLLLKQQEQGFFYWFGTLAALVILLVVSWGSVSDNWRKWARVAASLVYGGSLVVMAASQFAGLLPLGLLVAVVISWGYFMRGAGFKLPTLPAIVWVLLAGLLLRLPGMFESFWYDETFTAAFTRLPLDRLGAAVLSDVHPPLWYLIEWFNVRVFGFSEAAYRLPALLCGLLAIWLAYRLAGRLLDDRRYALLVAGFMAVLPALIYYSNESRGYSLLLCAVLALALAVIERRPYLWLAAAVVCLLTHNIGYVYVAVSGLLVCLVLMRGAHLRHGRRWLIALTGGAVVGLAWLPFMFLQSADVANGFWLQSLTAGGLLMPFVTTTLGGRVPDSVLLHTTGAVILVSLLSVYVSRRWLLSWPGVLVASWAFVPLLVALVSVLWRPVYLDRALMPAFMALPYCWAYALLYLYKSDRNTAAVLLAPALALALVSFYLPDSRRSDFNSLAAACRGSDVVYTSDLPAAFISSYYVADVVLWPAANDLNQTLPAAVKSDLFTTGYLEDQRGAVCLVDVVNALNSQGESDYLAAHIPSSARSQTVVSKSGYAVRVYRWSA